MIDQWSGLELRHLLALRSVAEEGSFRHAARRLGYTPSAVSQQIAALERVIGTQVVKRHGRKALGLSEAGDILLRHLTEIEAHIGAAKDEIDSVNAGIGGRLRVGAYESVAKRLLPGIIADMGASFPDLRIEVTDALVDLDLLRSLERGRLDIAFTTPPVPVGPFETRVVLRDPWVLVVSAAQPQHCAMPENLEELSELPLISFRSPRAIDRLAGRFRSAGIEPTFVLRSDYNDVVHEFAACGIGVALVPRLAAQPHDPRTRILDLSELIPPRDVGITWRLDREQNPARDAIIESAQRLAQEFCLEVGAALTMAA